MPRSIRSTSVCAFFASACIGSVEAGLEDGLVGYYPFEGGGDVLEDMSGNESHGDLLTAEQDQEGKFGKALRFNTIADAAQIDHSGSLLITHDDEGFTCSYWVNPDEPNVAGESRAVYSRRQFNIDLLNGQGRFEV